MRNKTSFFFILITFLILFSTINTDECETLILNFLKHYNPIDLANPLVSSGTGYNDFGKYDLCLDMNYKYYLYRISFNISYEKISPSFDAYIGLCIPEICYRDITFNKWKEFVEKHTGIKKENINIIKSMEENIKYNISSFSIVTIIIMVFIIILILFTSGIIKIGIDYYKSNNKDKIIPEYEINDIKNRDLLPIAMENPKIELNSNQSIFNKLLSTTCDIKINWKILVTQSKEKEISTIYGIKFISLFTLLFYTFSSIFCSYPIPIRNPEGTLEYIRNFKWQIIFNNNFSYDCLFLICGFALAFTYSKSEHCNQNQIKYFLKKMLYKFIGWYPLYIIVFFIYWKLFPFILDGPVSGDLFNNEIISCNKTYPFILALLLDLIPLYSITNNYNYLCYNWTWFVSATIHLYMIGYIIMMIYHKKRKLFWCVSIILLVSFCGIELYLLISNEYGITYYEKFILNKNNYYEKYFSKMYTNAFPFLLGMIFGVLYNSSKNNIILNTNRFFIGIILIFSIIVNIIIIFSAYCAYSLSNEEFINDIPLFVKITYNFIVKKFFVCNVYLILIISINLKNMFYYIGGFLNEKCFAYVNKLTLGCILIQPIIIRYILLNARYQLYFDGWYILFYGMATFALSILINTILSLLFQIPFKQFRLFLFPELQNKKYTVIHETK